MVLNIIIPISKIFIIVTVQYVPINIFSVGLNLGELDNYPSLPSNSRGLEYFGSLGENDTCIIGTNIDSVFEKLQLSSSTVVNG